LTLKKVFYICKGFYKDVVDIVTDIHDIIIILIKKSEG